MSKEYYLSKIDNMSNKFGDKLGEMLKIYNKNNLGEITIMEAKGYYEKIVNKGK